MQGYRVCPRSLRFSDDKERPGIERIRQRDKDKERMAKTQKGTDRQTAREKERERKGGKDTERDRERDRQTARQRDSERERQRQRETERGERQRQRETEERDRERQRDRGERQRQRERGESERYRERERERERDWYRGKKTNYFFLCHWNFNEKLVISFCTMAVPTHLFTTLALYCGDIDGFSSKEVQICSTLSSQLRAIFSAKWAF